MTRRFLPLLVFAVLVALFALPLLRGKDPSVLASAMIGKQVPDFDLPPAIAGTPALSSRDLSGHGVHVVNFFASWCVPCLAEQPVLMDLAREKGITVVGIAYKDPQADVAAWLAKNGNPFARAALDIDGRAGIDWGVYGVPETYILDDRGVIRYRHVGPLTTENVAADILPVLKGLQP